MQGFAQHVCVPILKDLDNLRWETVGSSVKQRLAELLDINLIEVMLRGWQKYALVNDDQRRRLAAKAKFLGLPLPADSFGLPAVLRLPTTCVQSLPGSDGLP